MDTRGISKLDLKRRNRKQILLAIREAGMLARVDIAAKLSLTRAAVTIITNQMIAQGILEDLNGPVTENPDEPKKKGRKKTMIRINPTYRYVLGAVINEDSVSVGLSNLANEVLDSDSMKLTDKTEQQEIVQFIVRSCTALMKKAGLGSKQMLGLGVGIVPRRWEQFRVDLNEGKVTFPKLCYLLEMELSMPVCAASAITLYALANTDYRADAGENQVLIYSGKSYHAAVITGKELLGGYSANTAAIDRLVVKANGRSAAGYPDGSVHAELTAEALTARAAELGKHMTIEEMNAAYLAGDADIRAILDEAVERMALLIYNYSTSHFADRIMLQNFRLNTETEQSLRSKLTALMGEEKQPELVFSDLVGDRAFLAGCSLIVEKQFFEMGGLQPGETIA